METSLLGYCCSSTVKQRANDYWSEFKLFSHAVYFPAQHSFKIFSDSTLPSWRQSSPVGTQPPSCLLSHPKDIVPVPLGSFWSCFCWLLLLFTFSCLFLEPAWVSTLLPLCWCFFVTRLLPPPHPQSLWSKQLFFFFGYICSVAELRLPLWELCWASQLSSKGKTQGFHAVSHWCLFLQELFSAALLWSTTTPPALCLATYPSTSQTPSGRMSGTHSVSNPKQRTRLFGLLNASIQCPVRALNQPAITGL